MPAFHMCLDENYKNILGRGLKKQTQSVFYTSLFFLHLWEQQSSKRRVTTNVCGMWRKENACALLVGHKLGQQPLGKTIWKSLKKNRTTIWSSIPLSRWISKGDENRVSKRRLHSHVHSSAVHSSKVWKQPQCPLMTADDGAHVYTVEQLRENPAICDNMD